MNKKEKAIVSIEKLILELNEVQDIKTGNTWKAVAKDTLVLYLGENSALAKRLEGLFFTKEVIKKEMTVMGEMNRNVNVFVDSHKDDFRTLLSNVLVYLKHNGIYTPPNQKGYYQFKQEIFWTVFGIGLPLIVTGSLYFANIRYDQSKIDLSDANRILRDSIKAQKAFIEGLQYNSDSAIMILGSMPYSEMDLTEKQFAKVQSTVERAADPLRNNSGIK